MDSSQVPAGQVFDRIVVHIGTERTGTTTIQRALSRNRARLARHGILFPTSLGRSSHGALATMSQSVEPRDEFARNSLRELGGTLAEARRQVPELFAREVAELETPAHTLVISSEHLHSRLVTLEEKQRFADFLTPWARSVEVYVYLRSQADLAKSVYNFRVKNGGSGDHAVYPALDARTRPYFDYLRMVEEYEQVFGEGSVRPIVFEPPTFPDKDVVRDFLTRAGLMVDGFEFRDSTNESLSAPALAYMREFNRFVPKRVRDQTQPLRRTVDRFAANYGGPAFATDPAEASAFQAHFDADNEALRARWFPERDVLFPVRKADQEPVEITQDDLMRFGARLYVRCQEEISNARRRARRLEGELRAERIRALGLEARLADARGDKAAAAAARDAAARIAEEDPELEIPLDDDAAGADAGPLRSIATAVRRRLRP